MAKKCKHCHKIMTDVAARSHTCPRDTDTYTSNGFDLASFVDTVVDTSYSSDSSNDFSGGGGDFGGGGSSSDW